MEIRFVSEKLKFEGKNEQGIWENITDGILDSNISTDLYKIDRYRIEVSLACDLRCQYCIVHMNNVEQQNKKMSIDTASAIIDRFNTEVGKNGSVFIIGGEPLTNKEVTKHIIKNISGSSVVFTNSYSLNNEMIDFFYENDTYILTSLDGYTLQQNEKRFAPNTKRTFDIVTGNIKNAIDRGCKVGVSCLLHKDNVDDAARIAEYFIKELGAKAMSFAYPHRTMDETEEDSFDFKKYSNALIDVYKVAKKYGVYVDQIGKIFSCLVYGYQTVIGCKAGTTQRTFYPDGTETICTKIDTQPGFNMDEYIRCLPIANTKCKGCVAYGLCNGECPWDFFVSSKRKGESLHKRVCDSHKYIVNYILQDIKSELSVAKTVNEARELFKNIFLPLAKNYSE